LENKHRSEGFSSLLAKLITSRGALQPEVHKIVQTQPLGDVSLGIKWSRHDADHSLPSGAEVKNAECVNLCDAEALPQNHKEYNKTQSRTVRILASVNIIHSSISCS
jgi:hypothetical protein